jgi:hypothetical protein
MNTANRLYKENTVNVGEVIVRGWNSKKPTDTAVWDENKSLLLQSEGKANHKQAWTGSEGSRKLRLPDFKTADA